MNTRKKILFEGIVRSTYKQLNESCRRVTNEALMNIAEDVTKIMNNGNSVIFLSAFSMEPVAEYTIKNRHYTFFVTFNYNYKLNTYDKFTILRHIKLDWHSENDGVYSADAESISHMLEELCELNYDDVYEIVSRYV